MLVLLCAAPARAADDGDANRWAELATTTHKAAQQTKDPKKYEEAAGYYDKYFAKPDGKEAVMAFYYAELLFNLERYSEAAKYYERNLTLDPKGHLAKEAAYAAMISWRNTIPAPKDPKTWPCPDSKPCALSANLQRLVAAFDRYLAIVPDSPEAPNVEYRKARVYYEHNQFAEAAPLFDHIFVTYPKCELAIYSANLEMDCLAMLKRHDDLRALVERVKKSPVMKDPVVQQQVRDNEAALKKLGK
jgi:tetratricopeptide (TPR) repeat protein